jgi:hypothetical protein
LIDEFAWRNLHDLHLRGQRRAGKKPSSWKFSGTCSGWLRPTIIWFRSNGVSTTAHKDARWPRRAPDWARDNFAGQEIDLTLTWSPVKTPQNYRRCTATSSPADYLRDTGRTTNADFGYVQAQLLF